VAVSGREFCLLISLGASFYVYVTFPTLNLSTTIRGVSPRVSACSSSVRIMRRSPGTKAMELSL